MVRRAFGSTLDDHTIEDIYASAWLGTLRNLEQRQGGLDDDEIRRYLFTAVARQASKELRRRRRRPVAPLENPDLVGDGQSPLEDRADQRERSKVTRDLLASLPRRRRAVLLLRYGWGLEPKQVCELINGLSPRAYRKEITRGVDELAERVRLLEDGRWCADREPILKTFAAGLADAEETRQAQHHLAHCRQCADFVGKLTGHLHDLGGAVALPAATDLAAHGRLSIADRLGDMADRGRDFFTGAFARGGEAASESGTTVASSLAPRGAAAAAAGAVAKLAALGFAGKAALVCLGGAAAAAVCVAGGFGLDIDRRAATPPERHASAGGPPTGRTIEGILPSQVGRTNLPPVQQPVSESPAQDHGPPSPASPPTDAPTTPAAVEQFGPAPPGSDAASGSPGPGESGGNRDRSPAEQSGAAASCSSSCSWEASLESSSDTVRSQPDSP